MRNHPQCRPTRQPQPHHKSVVIVCCPRHPTACQHTKQHCLQNLVTPQVCYAGTLRPAGMHPPGFQTKTMAVTHSATQPPHTHNRGHTIKQKLLRKEVIQPHLPVRLPCYDLVLITSPTFDGSPTTVRPPASGVTNFHDLTGGVYKPRERIHRSVADLRLLATPTSWGRVADPNPNYDRLSAISPPSRARKRVVPTIVACVKPWT